MTDKEAQELNELVARKLGWIYHPDLAPIVWQVPNNEIYLRTFPNYIGDIRVAWEIVESLKNHDIDLRHSNGTIGWLCKIFDWKGYPNTNQEELEAEADTAPEAIVRAFLKLPEEQLTKKTI